MERTIENMKHCHSLAQRFLTIVRDQPREESMLNLCMDALTNTLVAACSAPEVATAVVNAVVENEERWPAPATIRRYMRELAYVEVDKREAEDRKYREEQARRKVEDAGRGKPCSLEMGRRIDRIVMGILPTLRVGFLTDLRRCEGDDARTEEVLTRYESLVGAWKQQESSTPTKSPTQ